MVYKLCQPYSLHEKVLILHMANNGIFDEIPTNEVKACCLDLLKYIDLQHPEISKEIEEKKDLSDELSAKILEVAKEYMANK